MQKEHARHLHRGQCCASLAALHQPRHCAVRESVPAGGWKELLQVEPTTLMLEC